MFPLIFARRDGGRIKLSAPAVTKLRDFEQHEEHQAEAGGVLVGRWIRETEDVVVDDVSTPGPKDRRSRRGFFRDRSHHQEVLDEAWRMSGGAFTWLGEWHTHPEPRPRPSVVDLVGWGARLHRDRAPGPALFFVIVGTEEIAVWEWPRGLRVPRRLLLQTADNGVGQLPPSMGPEVEDPAPE